MSALQSKGNRLPSEALVSIIIPTFNRREYVADAIDSCLAQTYRNCEIIVIDDGSSDGTGHSLKERYGKRIRYINQENQGPGIARNRGIAAANGQFIHFLDADDQLHAEKIAIGLAAFRKHPEVSVIYTHYQQVASDGLTPVETGPFEGYSEDVYCELLRQTGCRILTSSSMFRSAALRAVGGFANDAQFRSAEDWDLFLRLALRYRFHGISEKLVYRRVHDSMISGDKLAGAYGRLKSRAERAQLWLGYLHDQMRNSIVWKRRGIMFTLSICGKLDAGRPPGSTFLAPPKFIRRLRGSAAYMPSTRAFCRRFRWISRCVLCAACGN